MRKLIRRLARIIINFVPKHLRACLIGLLEKQWRSSGIVLLICTFLILCFKYCPRTKWETIFSKLLHKISLLRSTRKHGSELKGIVTTKGQEKSHPFKNFPRAGVDSVMKSSFSQLSLLMMTRDRKATSLSELALFSDSASSSFQVTGFQARDANGDSTEIAGAWPGVPLGRSNESSNFMIGVGSVVNILKKRGIDTSVFRKAFLLTKIAIPSLFCKESLALLFLMGALTSRTFLSIWIASIHGAVVKTIVGLDFQGFCKCILILAGYSIPASFVNSSISYLNSILSLLFRRRLTYHFLRRYLHSMVFYHTTALDKRITHPDQRLTDDITRWCEALSLMFSNIAKPLLDICFLSRRLSETMGISGPLIVVLWYAFTALITPLISPRFGEYLAHSQALEGDYRASLTSLIDHSEEIAFYRGNYFELRRLVSAFEMLYRHAKQTFIKKLFMGVFDNMLVKHGAVIVGYGVLVLPVFAKGSSYDKPTDYPATSPKLLHRHDPSQITLDYVRNSSLLINLAKAIGRLVVSYKDMQTLNGLTTLICQLNDTLIDLQSGLYRDNNQNGEEVVQSTQNTGKFIESDRICFEKTPIVTPRGETLIEDLSFSISKGKNLFIIGPNGCGKSSLFRILGELWPLKGGKVYKPDATQMFYIPQRPYLPRGTLRDQIIYPDSKETFFKKGYRDTYLVSLLNDVSLEYLLTKRVSSNFETILNWDEQLSGGEKQRIAIARVCYHSPVFAILDEATSAVSVDFESTLYKYLINEGITLITISHRLHLLKFHDFLLRFDGMGSCSFEAISKSNLPHLQSYSNLMKQNKF